MGIVFSPEESRRLKIAFERFWEAISFAFADANLDLTRHARERLAGAILTLAQETRETEDRFSDTLAWLERPRRVAAGSSLELDPI
jgi:hypothetical protein